ncbi:MAG: proline/betaine transporter [uncultured bacterium]|nr:MAG: proline/betaine transporter [uncultured bacterium]
MPQYSKSKYKIVAAAAFGGALEIYDLVIYALLAPVIGQIFFPAENAWTSTLIIFSVLAMGFLLRPLGGMIYSHYGDRYGRKPALIYSILIMSIATCLIGLLPSYNSVGILSPLLLISLRMIQSISFGGDLPGAITFIAEHAPAQSRGLNTSWVLCGMNLGSVLCAVIASALIGLLSHNQLLSWGWRLPFLFGIFLGGVGIYLRQCADEPPIFKILKNSLAIVKSPVGYMLKKYIKTVIIAVIITWMIASVIGTLSIFMPTYLVRVIHLSLSKSILIYAIYSLGFSLLIPLVGFLSDKIGRKRILIAATFFVILFTYPLYLLLNKSHFIIVALFCFAMIQAGMMGALPSLLAELFPTAVRYSGVAMVFNLGYSIGIGLAPVMAALLLRITSNVASPGFYMIFCSVIGLLAILCLKENRVLK